MYINKSVIFFLIREFYPWKILAIKLFSKLLFIFSIGFKSKMSPSSAMKYYVAHNLNLDYIKVFIVHEERVNGFAFLFL